MKDDSSEGVDRLSIQSRPPGSPLMQHHWGKLLFMHWPISAELLRPLIPERLTVDTFEGTAWIGIMPFTLWGVRLSFTPPVPWLSEFHEHNVRTYVHTDGAARRMVPFTGCQQQGSLCWGREPSFICRTLTRASGLCRIK